MTCCLGYGFAAHTDADPKVFPVTSKEAEEHRRTGQRPRGARLIVPCQVCGAGIDDPAMAVPK